MSDNELTKLPDTNIEIEPASNEFRKSLASFLKADSAVKKMTFPRLRFPRLHRLGYFGEDYINIANKIESDAIKVYQTKQPQTEFNGTYCSYSSGDFFAFPLQAVNAISDYSSTIVHEATHAIQDLKEWKMSPLESEVDAHFAEAFYLVLSGRQSEIKSDLRMLYYVIVAEGFFEDEDFMTTSYFRQKRADLDNNVRVDYRAKQRAIKPNFDENKFNKEFEKRVRWDGVSG